MTLHDHYLPQFHFNEVLQIFSPDEFIPFNYPQHPKANWNFKLIPDKGKIILETETRIYCPDESSRKKFGRYWKIIKPFSGLIRMEMLRAIRRSAEES
jgi:hypothetical protein